MPSTVAKKMPRILMATIIQRRYMYAGKDGERGELVAVLGSELSIRTVA